jgi:predicted O-methyltransferase YrrM
MPNQFAQERPPATTIFHGKRSTMKTAHRILAALTACTVLIATPVSAAGQHGDEKYQPEVGQSGKDVIWVPTNDELVNKMLETAKVTASDIVYDLGAGDGKIPIAAARLFGARAVGIEFNPDMAALAKRNSERARVADKVKIIHGDIFKENFSEATVVTLYLLPELNLKLRPTILKMKPGTRVVSHAFNMGDWDPDQRIETSRATGYYWVVPANVEGQWRLEGLDGKPSATLQITQRYQRIGGTITLGGSTQALLGALIEGNQLTFRYLTSAGALQVVKATVNGNSLEGEAQSPNVFNQVKGTRR